MANPESIERHFYKCFVIEVELYHRPEKGFYVWPYIERTHTNGTSKQHFVLNGENFDTKEQALEAALVEGRRIIDQREQLDLVDDLIDEKLRSIESCRQTIIDNGARDGKTIATETILRHLEASKTNYQGIDRAAYVVAADKLAQDFRERYPETIPVDEAYRLMKECE